jgi:ABC-2 type transport system permease protein
MTFLARVWRSILPISHYIDIQIAQVNYGAAAMLSLPQLGHLALFILPGLAAGILAVKISGTSFRAQEAL